MASTFRGMALALGAAALASCTPLTGAEDPQPDGVRFTVEQSAYAPGDTVAATLRNESGVELGYNLCFTTLQRRAGAEWVVQDEPLMICTMELRILRPGGTALHRRALPPVLPAGEYRLAAQVEFPLNGSRVPLRSESFTVVP